MTKTKAEIAAEEYAEEVEKYSEHEVDTVAIRAAFSIGAAWREQEMRKGKISERIPDIATAVRMLSRLSMAHELYESPLLCEDIGALALWLKELSGGKEK